MFWPDSFAHFKSMIWAVLYEFQVLWAMPRLLKFASESAVSFGNSRCAKNLLEQPPVVPYFLLPLAGVGLKQEVCIVSCGAKREPVTNYVIGTYKLKWFWSPGLMIKEEHRVYLPDMSSGSSSRGRGQLMPGSIWESHFLGSARIFSHFARTAALS
jgi:hypothetical protein